MLLVIEICMFVVGIITLARGQFHLTAKIVVRGGRAYAIGIIMMLTLPIIFGLAVVAAAIMADMPMGEHDLFWLALIDLGVIGVAWAIIIPIGLTQPKTVDPWDIPIEQDDQDRPWRRRRSELEEHDGRDEGSGPTPLPGDSERIRRRDDRIR
ncbi:MAG: hypothetical protein K2X38_19190 [Gemmataceae bacterium]|nr:hypothetical protein [Gemmataceae bacterium]